MICRTAAAIANPIQHCQASWCKDLKWWKESLNESDSVTYRPYATQATHFKNDSSTRKAIANIRVVICPASSYHPQPYDTTHYFEEGKATWAACLPYWDREHAYHHSHVIRVHFCFKRVDKTCFLTVAPVWCAGYSKSALPFTTFHIYLSVISTRITLASWHHFFLRWNISCCCGGGGMLWFCIPPSLFLQ